MGPAAPPTMPRAGELMPAELGAPAVTPPGEPAPLGDVAAQASTPPVVGGLP